MPEGFDPHVSLERISTLRDVMVGCRQMVPTILTQARELLDLPLDNPMLPPGERMKLWDLLLNRGYGKPRQHVYVSDGNQTEEKRVKVYLPDNGRAANVGPVIEVENV